ncbi:hypothetical protein BDA99DRAFT_533640 [Phascolomyces articulosus]|uniref:Uncharacterized protein n=1 Tax=Phascolomyces articulosus TaxID=60185 RepID=A0AAD5PI01_9FUNG|nr:hypothetical protein BDA99DRAFT_533640 [Phascolomyces articulosus]
MKRMFSKLTIGGVGFRSSSTNGHRKAASVLVDPYMAPHDIAKLNRRNEILEALDKIPLRPSFDTFRFITHDYIELGIGNLHTILSRLINVDWLEKNTNFERIEIADMQIRYQVALDGWLMRRLEQGQWEDFRAHHDIPSSLYSILVGRVHVIWERFAIEKLLKYERTIYRRILTYDVNNNMNNKKKQVEKDQVKFSNQEKHDEDCDADDEDDNTSTIAQSSPKTRQEQELENLILDVLECHIIVRNDEEQTLRQAMELKFGIDGFGGFMRRAKKELQDYVRRLFINEFQKNPPPETLGIFKDIYEAMIRDHVSQLSISMNVHPTLIEHAIRDMPLFGHKHG